MASTNPIRYNFVTIWTVLSCNTTFLTILGNRNQFMMLLCNWRSITIQNVTINVIWSGSQMPFLGWTVHRLLKVFFFFLIGFLATGNPVMDIRWITRCYPWAFWEIQDYLPRWPPSTLWYITSDLLRTILLYDATCLTISSIRNIFVMLFWWLEANNNAKYNNK